jgi:RND family efflux transporter MFP subunit
MNFFTSGPLAGRKVRIALLLLVIGAVLVFVRAGSGEPAPEAPKAEAAVKPALTVSLIAPETQEWPRILVANGNVVAWQEAVIGAEIANYRITEVAAQVGDRVKKGQVLARIASDTVASELAEAKAAVAELAASASEARGNSARAAELKAKGFYSTQLNNQYQTAEQTTQARLEAARARQQAAALRLSKTSVLAPDDGVISARSASVGSLTQPGQELFRLIRGGRLEWRAELPSADLVAVKAGALAALVNPNGETVKGTVRAVAPSVDPQTRNGLVYVDLPVGSAVRAGMFARGEFELGRSQALTLPQSAVVRREGFAYVFRLEAGDRVAQTKVALGRQQGERIEVVSGLAAGEQVVESGVGFLAGGDLVKVVAGNAAGKAQ